MKLFIVYLLFLIPIHWETDFEAAKKSAKENHKFILLNFSGSDWCAPCILLRRDYLESDVFSKMADERLVLVNADFPRQKKNRLSKEQVSKNEALADIYNKEGNFPMTLLLDAEGKVVKSWKGKPEQSVEEWTAEINKICLANR
ncbi:MAG: thioredoxin family protein [Flavobacterium sp.]|nr:MAG: thioredoxin family protein [Flavobacterium sp.]